MTNYRRGQQIGIGGSNAAVNGPSRPRSSRATLSLFESPSRRIANFW